MKVTKKKIECPTKERERVKNYKEKKIGGNAGNERKQETLLPFSFILSLFFSD